MEELYCVGCGIKLQTEDETKEGYVDKKALTREFVLCKRCYQLKHYGKFIESKELKNTIKLLHENANNNDLIVLISDVSFLNTPLIKVLKELNYYKNVCLVCNRYDLYKNYISKEKAMKFVKNELKVNQIKVSKVFILDNNVSEIFDYMDNNSIENDVYLVGLENAGKTSLINLILKEVAQEEKNFLTNSKYPGTTIDLIKISLDDNHYLIDTPGIYSKGNLLHFVEFDFLKKLQNDRKLKQSAYQIQSEQSLIVSNVLVLDYVSGDKQSILFMGSSMLNITRCKLINSKTTFDNLLNDLKVKSSKVNNYDDLITLTIKVLNNERKDLVIEGLGFFTIGSGTYKIHTLKGVNVFLRNKMI